MGAFICEVCDSIRDSQDDLFYECQRCHARMCGECWDDMVHDDHLDDEDTCGECWYELTIKAGELTEPDEEGEEE